MSGPALKGSGGPIALSLSQRPLPMPPLRPSAALADASGGRGGAGTAVAEPAVGQSSWLESAHSFDPAELELSDSAAAAEPKAWPANPFTPAPPTVLAEGAGFDTAPNTLPIFGLKRVVPNLRAPGRPRRRERSGGHGRAGSWGPVALVLTGTVLLLLVVAGALLVPELLRESETTQVDELLAEGRLRFRAASLAQEPEIVLEELELAVASVEEALKLEPGHEEAAAFGAEIEGALLQINLIVQPQDVTVVLDFSTLVAPPFALGAVEVGGEEVYVLDGSGGRVFALPIEGAGEPVTLLRRGEQVGTQTAGEPISMHWVANESSLYILDAERQIFRYSPGAGLSAIVLPNAEALGSVDAIATEGTAVYLLDVAGGSVWRYATGPDGLLTEGVPVVERVELSGANSIVVASAIFVASSDGRVRRFLEGSEQGFAQVGLDRPLLLAASLELGSQSGLIYAADRGNNRVVVFGPTGELRLQIRDDLLAGLRAVAVDEAAGRLYYVTPDALLTSTLPRFPADGETAAGSN